MINIPQNENLLRNNFNEIVKEHDAITNRVIRHILEDINDFGASKHNYSSAGCVCFSCFETAAKLFAAKGYYAKLKYKKCKDGSVSRFSHIIVSKYPLKDNTNEKYLDQMIS